MNKSIEEIKFDQKYPPTIRKVEINVKSTGKEYRACKICYRQYQRWNKRKHEKTQIHKLYASMDQKLKDILHIENKV